jgi:hypothetical protein
LDVHGSNPFFCSEISLTQVYPESAPRKQVSIFDSAPEKRTSGLTGERVFDSAGRR